MTAAPFRAGSRVYRLAAGAAGVSVTLAWGGRQFSNDVCSSLLHDGAVYGFDIHQAQASVHRPARGSFKCLDLASGKVHWDTEEVGQGSAIYADGKLVVWTETGTLVLVKPSPAGYEELARAQLLGGGGMCWAAPALADKRLIVRDRTRAVCVYLGPPAELAPGRATQTFARAADGFDWTRLVPTEPDFPNDEPSVREVAVWFAAGAGILAACAALGLACRRWLTSRYAVAAFAVPAFALGAAGTTAVGAWFDAFVLTWPVSLYVAFRGTIALGLDRTARGWRHHVGARLALVLFVALCYGYYRLCMAVGFALAWGFLGGFASALPLAVVANRVENQRIRWLLDALGFAVYFWTSASIPGWKARLDGG